MAGPSTREALNVEEFRAISSSGRLAPHLRDERLPGRNMERVHHPQQRREQKRPPDPNGEAVSVSITSRCRGKRSAAVPPAGAKRNTGIRIEKPTSPDNRL